MKKYILLFIGILLLGGLAIYLPHSLSISQQNNMAKEVKDTNNVIIGKESTNDSLGQSEIPFDKLESEQFDQSQIYYKNIDVLYKYFTFKQVDQIKQRLHFFLLNNLKDVKDCSITTGSIKNNNGVFTFEITVPNYKPLVIDVKKDSDNSITDISISQSIIQGE